jgi:hypothetical protein
VQRIDGSSLHMTTLRTEISSCDMPELPAHRVKPENDNFSPAHATFLRKSLSLVSGVHLTESMAKLFRASADSAWLLHLDLRFDARCKISEERSAETNIVGSKTWAPTRAHPKLLLPNFSQIIAPNIELQGWSISPPSKAKSQGRLSWSHWIIGTW